jgi:hypothetical protein
MSRLDMLLNEGERAARLRSDLPYFAEHCLKLRPKTGSSASFVFNPAQLELHRRIEEQKAKIGRVRVIILKARQLGISTYVSARFFHRCLFEPGLRTFILGHERRASTNLFEMVKRFYEHLPEDVRPATGTFNAETLLFNNDSGYIVSVATLDGAGRSATAQLLHASEAAFWPDLEAQIASLFQIVPDVDGSEAIIESTANGYNDFKVMAIGEAAPLNYCHVFALVVDQTIEKSLMKILRSRLRRLNSRSCTDLKTHKSLGGVRRHNSSASVCPKSFPSLRARLLFPVRSIASFHRNSSLKREKQRIEDDFG